MNKAISIVLSLAMFIAFIPSFAFAAEEGGDFAVDYEKEIFQREIEEYDAEWDEYYISYEDVERDPTGAGTYAVYITGKRYHCDEDCRGLRNARAIYKVTLQKAKKKKLTKCHVCYY